MERSQVRDDYLFAVIQLDIDRFKDVNDSLGHLVGDQLLQSIGHILLDSVSAVDTVARLGDDEFVVLLEELPSRKAGTATIKKIKSALNRTLDVEQHPIHISACFGALFGPNEYTSPEYFLQGANIALRHAQEQGLDQLRFYAPEMQDKALKKTGHGNTSAQRYQRKRALPRPATYFLHRPEPDPERLRGPLALEAQGQRLGSPQRIHPHCRTDRAHPAHWTVGAGAILQGTAILAEKYPENTFSVSVNLSARQFSDPDLVQNLFNCIRHTRINPSQLKLEITESDVMTNPEATIQKLRIMKELGMAILVDDFGTGYSSMSYLQRFPIDTLKIDRSFVTHLDKHANRVIVRTIVNLAHSLGLSVVAEGIESESQYQTLREMGCEYAQGYHFSRPILLDQIDEFIREHI